MAEQNIFGPPVIDEEEEVFTRSMFANNQMPKNLPGHLFKTPERPADLAPLDLSSLLLDRDIFAETFSAPAKTTEELEAMFPKEDYSDEKWMAIAKAGLALMQPTIGGQIAPAISNAGTQLLNEVGAIKAAQKADDKQRRSSILSLQQQEEATKLQLQAQAFGINQDLLTQQFIRNFEERAKTNTAKWEAYNKAVNLNAEEALKFGIKKFESKPVTIRYVDGEGNTQEDAAFLVNDQYYIPTQQKDPTTDDWIYELVPDPTSVEVISTKNQDVDGITKGKSQFIKIKGAFDTSDKAIYFLDQIISSLDPGQGGNPRRAGFIAGIQKYLQTYGMIASDFSKGFFADENSYVDSSGKTKSKAGWISDLADYMAYGEDVPEDMKAEWGRIDSVLDFLEAEGLAAMKNDRLGKKNWTGEIGFEGTMGRSDEEERALIFNRLGFDRKLPENEARAQAIIYALARARKSTGRLNMDDIERAAQTLNIYGDSAEDVITKLGVVKEEMIIGRNGQIELMEMLYPDELAKLTEMRGGTIDYNPDYYTKIFESAYKKDEPKTYVVTIVDGKPVFTPKAL
jgi:hypothetical protein